MLTPVHCQKYQHLIFFYILVISKVTYREGIHTHSHTEDAAFGSNLGFSIFPKDTSTCRPNQRCILSARHFLHILLKKRNFPLVRLCFEDFICMSTKKIYDVPLVHLLVVEFILRGQVHIFSMSISKQHSHAHMYIPTGFGCCHGVSVL